MWTEEMIREEMRKLDERTGLHGSELPIVFGTAKTRVGGLGVRDGKPSRAQAYDLIRHEYAHYMDVCRRGTSDHGPHWKACCQELGEDLDRCFSPLLNRFRLALERDEPLDSMLYELIPFLDDPEANQPKRRKKSAA